jgi:hypothetical protein
MKELSIFITELSDSLGEPLFPINVLHGKEVNDMILNDVTKKGLMTEQISNFLKLVQKGNCHVLCPMLNYTTFVLGEFEVFR